MTLIIYVMKNRNKMRLAVLGFDRTKVAKKHALLLAFIFILYTLNSTLLS